jgi:hypothetical protein
MLVVDATCLKCRVPFRWHPGTTQLCGECRGKVVVRIHVKSVDSEPRVIRVAKG